MRECPKCHRMTLAYDPYFKAECCTSMECAHREEPKVETKRVKLIEDGDMVYVVEAGHLQTAPRRQFKRAMRSILHFSTLGQR